MNIKNTLKNNKYFIIGLASTLAFLLVWELVAIIINVEIVLPRFSAVVVEFGLLLASGDTYIAIGASLLRCLISFTLALSFGVVLGGLAGLNRYFASVMHPIITAMRTLPTLAIVLILLLSLGKNLAPIFIGFMLAFPIIFQTAKVAVASVDKRVIELSKLDGVKPLRALSLFYMPLSMPAIIGAISATFGLTIKAVISAEVLAYTPNSIGKEMMFASLDSLLASVPTLFAWVGVALVLSIGIETIITSILKKYRA